MASRCALYHAENRMNATCTYSDEILMELLAQGQENALADIVRRHQNDVFRFCLHYLKDVELAKEAAQETFLRVYVARERFDAARKFKPWMLCIARNLCLNELKRKKTVQMETLEEYASTSREESGTVLPYSEDGPAEQLIAQERQRALLDVLDSLPEESREIVVLRYFEQMSAREIADIVDSTEGAIRTRLHRILRELRDRCAPYREVL